MDESTLEQLRGMTNEQLVDKENALRTEMQRLRLVADACFQIRVARDAVVSLREADAAISRASVARQHRETDMALVRAWVCTCTVCVRERYWGEVR